MPASSYADALSIDQLRVLTTIVSAGSFSAAARRLKRSQGAISYQVASLEDSLELQLFDRSTRRPTLTGVGEALVEEARRVLSGVDELRQKAHELRGGVEPQLGIAVDVLFPPALLAMTLRAFGETFPHVSLELRAGILGDVPRQIASGALDVGVAGQLDMSPEIVRGPALSEVQLVPVVSPDHPLAKCRGRIGARELERHVHVLLTDGSGGEIEQRTGRRGERQRRVWRTTDLGTRLELIRAGLGWARVPLHSVAEELDSGALVELRLTGRQSRIRVNLHAIHSSTRVLGPAARWLIQHLAARNAHGADAS